MYMQHVADTKTVLFLPVPWWDAVLLETPAYRTHQWVMPQCGVAPSMLHRPVRGRGCRSDACADARMRSAAHLSRSL